jgi:hypothetical protein
MILVIKMIKEIKMDELIQSQRAGLGEVYY